MRRIIEFDHGHDRGVFIAHDKIGAHAVDAVQPGLVVVAFLDAQQARELDLRQNDVPRQRLDQAEIENLFRLRQRLFCIKRPRLIAGTALRLCFKESEKDDRNHHQQQQ